MLELSEAERAKEGDFWTKMSMQRRYNVQGFETRWVHSLTQSLSFAAAGFFRDEMKMGQEAERLLQRSHCFGLISLFDFLQLGPLSILIYTMFGKIILLLFIFWICLYFFSLSPIYESIIKWYTVHKTKPMFQNLDGLVKLVKLKTYLKLN